MRKKINTWLTSILVGISAFSILGGVLPMPVSRRASADSQTATEIQPVANYTFDKTGTAWLENTGSWGESYDLQGSTYAKRENWGENSGGVNFSDDSCLYLTGDKYIFNRLDSFTVAVDFYAERNPNWYSSLFSWDVLSEDGFTNMSRFSIGYKTGQDWLRYSDVEILGSMAQEGTSYGAFFSKGESLLSQNVNNSNSGWWKFIYSVQPGGVAISYLTTGTSNVNYIEVNKVPADYSLKSENAVFSIGASFKNSAGGIEWKANAILDNLKIYDFAMTEEQMTELRWTGKVCKSPITISSTIENGTVTANKAEALTGERVLLDVQPDVGYEIDKVYVNDMEILPLDGIYYTKMTKAGVSVYATFKEIVLEEEEPDSSGNSLNNSASNEINSEVNSDASSESVQEELTSLNSEQEQSGASEKSGCFGTVSAMAIPIIFATMSAGLCIRKKEYE